MSASWKTTIELINKIERAIDVNALRAHGLYVWPYARLRIIIQLAQMEHDFPPIAFPVPPLAQLTRSIGPGGEKNLETQRLLLDVRKARQAEHIAQKRALRPFNPIDVLVVSIAEHCSQNVRNGLYSPVLDPIFESFSEYGRVLKVEVGPGLGQVPGRAHPTLSINPNPFTTARAIDAFLTSGREPKEEEDAREVERELYRFLCEEYPSLDWAGERFLDNSLTLRHYGDFFVDLLSHLGVRCTVQTPHYHEVGMALNQACYELNIPSVDVQHAVLTGDNPHYLQFFKTPEGGYPMLPDSLWVWSKGTADMVNSLSSHEVGGVEAIVAGNPWHQRIGLRQDDIVDETTIRALVNLSDYKHVVLVALQYPTPDPLPEIVRQAMENSPSDWFWLIRYHPRSPENLRNSIETELRERGLLNWESDIANSTPLPVLLRYVSHVMTRYSSTCMEGASLGIPSTFFDPTARDYYPQLLELGISRLAESSQSIIDSILEGRSTEITQSAMFASGIDSTNGLLKKATHTIWERMG